MCRMPVIAHYVFILCTRLRWIVKFMSWLIKAGGKLSCYPLNTRVDGPNRTSREKNVSCLYLKSNANPWPSSQFLYHSTNIITTIPNTMLRATFSSKTNVNGKYKGVFWFSDRTVIYWGLDGSRHWRMLLWYEIMPINVVEVCRRFREPCCLSFNCNWLL